MKYNKENYEAFALDYIENNLSEEDRAEFEVFLLLNPEIQDAIREFEWVEVPMLQGVSHPNKNALLKDLGGRKVVFFSSKLIAIAATVALLLTIVFFQSQPDQPAAGIVENTPILVPPITPEHQPIAEKKVASVDPPAQSKVLSSAASPTIPKEQAYTTPIPKQEQVVENMVGNDDYADVVEDQADETEVALQELLQVDDRVVYQVAMIEQNATTLIPDKKYELEELDFPELVIDEEELLDKEPSKFKRFLAKANLIPSDFTPDDYSSFKQNLLPESIPGLK